MDCAAGEVCTAALFVDVDGVNCGCGGDVACKTEMTDGVGGGQSGADTTATAGEQILVSFVADEGGEMLTLGDAMTDDGLDLGVFGLHVHALPRLPHFTHNLTGGGRLLLSAAIALPKLM